MGTHTGVLFADDIQLARRTEAAWKRGVQERVLSPGHGEADRSANPDRDINGALGEIAYAKHFGLPIQEIRGVFRKPDFGRVEVRTTVWPNGRLPVFDADDRENTMFVLVCIKKDLPNRCDYRIAGEIPGWRVADCCEDPGNRIRPGSQPQVWVNQKHLEPHFGPQAILPF